MGYISWGLEVIWFSHNCFIKIGQVKTNSKLEISLLILVLYPDRAVDLRSCLVHRLQNSCLLHLVNLLLESFFQMHRDWSTGGLLWCDTGIHLNMVWGTRKASNTIINIRIIGKNLFFACNVLGNHTFEVRHFRQYLWNMSTDFGFGLLWMVSTTSNKTGSGWKIVQSVLRLYQAKSKSCHTW